MPDEAQALRAWLFRILRNAWIDQHRRAAVSRVLESEAAPQEPEVWHFDDRLIDGLSLREALAQLDPLHRDIVALIDIAGFRYREVAAILEVPLGTVMSRLSRARLALLEAIGGKVALLSAARRRRS